MQIRETTEEYCIHETATKYKDWRMLAVDKNLIVKWF